MLSIWAVEPGNRSADWAALKGPCGRRLPALRSNLGPVCITVNEIGTLRRLQIADRFVKLRLLSEGLGDVSQLNCRALT